MFNFRSLLLPAFIALSSLPSMAMAEPKLDFVPVSMSFSKGLDDDVSNTYSQHVSLFVKNTGNVTWHNQDLLMRVLLDGAAISAYMYGPVSTYWQLGAAIAPGQQGLVQFSLPLNTLRHCQTRTIRIDADRTQQSGIAVFSNDLKSMIAVDRTAIRICPGNIGPIHQ